ncbi:ABC transporter ATP-binding protein [Treponema sp.]
MIRFKGVTKSFASKLVLKGIDFAVPSGILCAIVGPSGCGKSTTIRLANRLIEPDSGKVYIDDQDIAQVNAVQLRRSIGYVIQQVGLFPHKSVADNIETVPRLLGWPRSKRQDRSAELLDLVGLDPTLYAHRAPAELSGGEAQRVGVARALAADPPIVLMDEPFGAVDPLTREILQREFLAIQKKLRKTVLFVTHDIDEAMKMADLVLVLRDGNIAQFDDPDQVLAHPADRFVRSFVGSDRALKRLRRYPIKDTLRGSVPVQLDALVDAKLIAELRALERLWVLDSGQHVKGYLDLKSIAAVKPQEKALVQDLMHPVRAMDLAVSRDASLLDALARMLGQGAKLVPVIDDDWRFVGEIGMAEIEKIAKSGDFGW